MTNFKIGNVLRGHWMFEMPDDNVYKAWDHGRKLMDELGKKGIMVYLEMETKVSHVRVTKTELKQIQKSEDHPCHRLTNSIIVAVGRTDEPLCGEYYGNY